MYYPEAMRKFSAGLCMALTLAATCAVAEPKLNLNTATKEQLTAIGFTESQAIQLVSYRQENGPLLQVEELTAVPQINKATFEKLRDKVTVDE